MVVPSELRTEGGGMVITLFREHCKRCPERLGVQQDQIGRFDLMGGRNCGIGRFEFCARLLLLLL